MSRQEKSGGTPAGDLGAGGPVRSASLLQAREAGEEPLTSPGQRGQTPALLLRSLSPVSITLTPACQSDLTAGLLTLLKGRLMNPPQPTLLWT